LNFCPTDKSLFIGDSCIKNNSHLKSFGEFGPEMFFSSARGGTMNAGAETCGEEENVDGPGIFQLIDKLEQMIDHMVPQASGSHDLTEKRYSNKIKIFLS
jgi:hypothetical protein